MGMNNESYRLRYTKTGGFYRLHIIGDKSGKVAGIKFENRPSLAATRNFLAAKGFESYGDLRRNHDGSFTSMVRPIA